MAQPKADAPRRPADAVVIDEVVLPELPDLPKGKTKQDFMRDTKVTTRSEGDITVTEFRLKGQLYKMVVKPAKGPAYTLIDEKGEGKFVRMGEVDTKISVPMWVLLSW
ncbi:MAG: DUF2782 domain-containing protein [Pseudomonadota bacterium]